MEATSSRHGGDEVSAAQAAGAPHSTRGEALHASRIPAAPVPRDETPGAGGRHSRPLGVPSWCWVLALFTTLSFAIFANTWFVHPGGFIGGDGDPQILIWNLGWTPFQLAHGHNPLVTDYLDYPASVNLMWQASLIVPSLMLWPVTALFGPVASYNLLATLTLALTGFCGYLALRRYAGVVASAVGGLVYGFSPYMVAQVGGHDHVAIALYPALALLALDDILVRQRRSPALVGALLGAATAVQLLTGEEILATTVLMAVVGVIVLAVLHRRAILPRVRHAVTALGVAALVAAVLVAYPLKVQFFGPAQVHGALQAKNTYVTDLLNLVVPTANQRFHTDGAIAMQLRFSGNMSESNAYLGIPLILLLLGAVVLLRRSQVARWAALMIGVTLVLSMGAHLHVAGHDTRIRLPWALIGNRGLLENVLPSRLAVYAFLMIALVLALLVDRLLAARRRLVRIAGCATVALGLLPLLPITPLFSTQPENPSFFTSSAVQRIPAGSVALVIPYASGASLTARAMLWQAEAGYRFRMPEGQAFRPGPTQDPPPSKLQSVLVALQVGQPPPLTGDLALQLRSDLRALGVRTVVVGPSNNQDAAVALFSSVLGEAPESTGGVSVFWKAGADLGL